MKDNCIGCEYLRKFCKYKCYACIKYRSALEYNYTDSEYPLVQPCDACKDESKC